MKANNEARVARKATGLSQSEFAFALDIPVGTIRNWEQSRRALLMAISNATVTAKHLA